MASQPQQQNLTNPKDSKDNMKSKPDQYSNQGGGNVKDEPTSGGRVGNNIEKDEPLSQNKQGGMGGQS